LSHKLVEDPFGRSLRSCVPAIPDQLFRQGFIRRRRAGLPTRRPGCLHQGDLLHPVSGRIPISSMLVRSRTLSAAHY